MATTASGFWYPDEGTAFNINTIMSTAMSSVETKAGPHVGDTGWVDIPPTGGFTGSLTYRKVGKLIEVIAVGSGSFPSGSGVTLGSLPVAIRPLGVRRGAAGYNAGNTGSLGVYSNGDIIATHATGATRTAVQATVTYFVS